MNRSMRTASALAALFCLAASGRAMADDAGTPGAEANGRLAEVLVVGQREAPITVVPRGLSVSLGEEQFDAINALNVEDLMKYAPNFFVRVAPPCAPKTSTSRPWIRHSSSVCA